MNERWTIDAQLEDRRRRIRTTSFDERLAWLAEALNVASESGALQRERQRRLDESGSEVVAFARVSERCRAFGDVERAELQGRPLFRVGRRRFAIFNSGYAPRRPRWAGQGCSLHFLTDPAEVDALRSDRRFSLSPHHGDRGWLALRLDTDDVDWDEVGELIDSAHAQVSTSRRESYGSS